MPARNMTMKTLQRILGAKNFAKIKNVDFNNDGFDIELYDEFITEKHLASYFKYAHYDYMPELVQDVKNYFNSCTSIPTRQAKTSVKASPKPKKAKKPDIPQIKEVIKPDNFNTQEIYTDHQYLMEITDWADTSINVPSNIFILNKQDMLVGLLNKFGTLHFFVRPLQFDKRNRKFIKLSKELLNF